MTTQDYLSSLPIYQPQGPLGEPMSRACTSWEVAWAVADAIGAPQVTDLLWTACVFDIADEAAARRIGRQHRLCDHRYYCMRTVGDTPYWE